MSICAIRWLSLSTLELPVAKTWCQKSAIFSSSGRCVLTIWKSQLAAPGVVTGPPEASEGM